MKVGDVRVAARVVSTLWSGVALRLEPWGMLAYVGVRSFDGRAECMLWGREREDVVGSEARKKERGVERWA